RERALHLPRARAAWVALSEPRSARAPCSYRPSRPKRLAARDRGGLPLSLTFRASSSGKAEPSRLSAAFAPVVLAIALLSLRAPNANSASESASVSAIPSGVSPKSRLRADRSDVLRASKRALPIVTVPEWRWRVRSRYRVVVRICAIGIGHLFMTGEFAGACVGDSLEGNSSFLAGRGAIGAFDRVGRALSCESTSGIGGPNHESNAGT